MKTKYWVIALGALFILCLGLSIWLLMPGEAAQAVEVRSGGKLLYTLPLDTDTQVTVTNGQGSNTVTVRDGKVAVTQANCPDGHCMARGFCHSGASIVCLPNSLVLSFTDGGELDAIAG
ncbi:MAG: NusG domain II-containing protein [Ruminococcaceae bacterium]|nr:NusG domain II-containing protein [Oscillospiraceae bacterium]